MRERSEESQILLVPRPSFLLSLPLSLSLSLSLSSSSSRDSLTYLRFPVFV